MRKKLIGIILLVLAAWVLLQGSFNIPFIDFHLAPLLVSILFAYLAIEEILKGSLTSCIILAVIALVIVNNSYDIFPISSGMLFLAGVLACVGLHMIIKPNYTRKTLLFWKDDNFKKREHSFGTVNRYINSDNFVHDKVEVSFGSANIYFDNAQIINESASFSVEVAFGTVSLYVPSSWQVELSVDNAFGSVNNPRNVNQKEKTLYVQGNVAFGNLKIFYI
ncbi:MAG: hypothetical protein Q4A90_03070 [Streptococcus sp.]|nr:hypothetical protein [Streptococcus sp.]